MKMINYHSNTSVKPCLLTKVGRTRIHVLSYTEHGLKLKSLPMAELAFCKDLDYPVRRALTRYRKIARRLKLKNVPKNVREVLNV